MGVAIWRHNYKLIDIFELIWYRVNKMCEFIHEIN